MNRAAIGVLGALTVLTAACSMTPAPNVASSPKPAQTPSGTTTSAAAGLMCKLPVIQWTQFGQTTQRSTGFIQFPDDQVRPDRNGTFELDGTRYRSIVQPYLYGGGPVSYDWAAGRWLPAEPRGISPDGAHFALSDFGFIRVVDVATGLERKFTVAQGPDTVIYWAREGIYFNHAWEGPPGPGLWLLDPATGSVQTVFSDQPVITVGGFAAWIPDVNPADPHPVFSQYGATNLPNRILRRDLNGGSTVPWFYRPGRTLSVIGFDQDRHPLISVQTDGPDSTVAIWQVTAPNEGREVYSGSQVPWFMADEHGIWFADRRGIWLFTTSQGLQKVSNAVVQLAGPCR